MLLGHNFLNYLKRRLNYHSIYRGLTSSEGVMSVSLPLDEERGESSGAPEGENSSLSDAAMSGTSLIFGVQYIHDLWRNSKFLHRGTSIWQMFCKVLGKVIFMFCVAMCGVTWDCRTGGAIFCWHSIKPRWKLLGLLHQGGTISPVMKVTLSLHREILSWLSIKEPQGR